MRSKLSPAFAALILHAVALAAVLLTVSGCEKSGDGSLPKPEPTVEENVSLSLGSGTITKTILGEPDGSSYPVYWYEGDRIAVNRTSSRDWRKGYRRDIQRVRSQRPLWRGLS